MIYQRNEKKRCMNMEYSKNKSPKTSINCPNCNSNINTNDEYSNSSKVIQDHYEYECPNCGKPDLFYNKN